MCFYGIRITECGCVATTSTMAKLTTIKCKSISWKIDQSQVVWVFSLRSLESATGKDGIGFFFIDTNGNVCYAGLGPCMFAEKLEIGLKPLCLALHHCNDAREKCSNIYINSDDVWKVIVLYDDLICWRHMDSIDTV